MHFCFLVLLLPAVPLGLVFLVSGEGCAVELQCFLVWRQDQSQWVRGDDIQGCYGWLLGEELPKPGPGPQGALGPYHVRQVQTLLRSLSWISQPAEERWQTGHHQQEKRCPLPLTYWWRHWSLAKVSCLEVCLWLVTSNIKTISVK